MVIGGLLMVNMVVKEGDGDVSFILEKNLFCKIYKHFSCNVEEFTCGDGLCLPLDQRFSSRSPITIIVFVIFIAFAITVVVVVIVIK